jgi:hypothetical protein
MSETIGYEHFPGPDEVVRQMQVYLAESLVLIHTHAWSDNFRNALGGTRMQPPGLVPPEIETIADTDVQPDSMANEFAALFTETSQAIKQHGYQFAVNHPHAGMGRPVMNIGLNKDDSTGTIVGYLAQVTHPNGFPILVQLTPESLTYQRYEPPQQRQF